MTVRRLDWRAYYQRWEAGILCPVTNTCHWLTLEAKRRAKAERLAPAAYEILLRESAIRARAKADEYMRMAERLEAEAAEVRK